MYNKDTDGHAILFCKNHYDSRDLNNLWKIHNKIYLLSSDEIRIPRLADWLLDIVSDLNLVFNNDYRRRQFFEDMAPENTWKVGYATKHSRFGNHNEVEYDYFTALLYACMSILGGCQIKDKDKNDEWKIIIELPEPDENMATFSPDKIKEIIKRSFE